ncbi:MAG: 30S ribosome-binding factor RbfA [Phycisphaerae bacterium]|nr:30S ribosome-binding factor RbfA [Phycisphaerae bacterium]
MSRRTEKVASTIRQVLSQGIATKLSDPRISQFTSITRVEVSGDLMNASVYISVMGSETDERTTMAGLQHARGFLQSLLAKALPTRHCPQLRFVADRGMKKQIETLALLDQISEERRQAELSQSSPDDGAPEDAGRSEGDADTPDEHGQVQTPPGDSL